MNLAPFREAWAPLEERLHKAYLLREQGSFDCVHCDTGGRFQHLGARIDRALDGLLAKLGREISQQRVEQLRGRLRPQQEGELIHPASVRRVPEDDQP